MKGPLDRPIPGEDRLRSVAVKILAISTLVAIVAVVTVVVSALILAAAWIWAQTGAILHG